MELYAILTRVYYIQGSPERSDIFFAFQIPEGEDKKRSFQRLREQVKKLAGEPQGYTELDEYHYTYTVNHDVDLDKLTSIEPILEAAKCRDGTLEIEVKLQDYDTWRQQKIEASISVAA